MRPGAPGDPSAIPSGALQRWQFGQNAAVGTPYETLWIVGGVYPWTAWPDWDDDTGATVTVESDEAADTSIVVAYEGLGADGALVSGTVTTDATDGTDPATLPDTLNRLHRAYRKSPDGASAGNLIFKVGATVVAQIAPEIGATQLGFYTVPAGYRAYLQSIQASVDRNNDADVQLMERPAGEAWRSFSGAMTVSGASPPINYSANGWKSAPSFAAGTDLECKGVNLGGGSSILSVNFHLVMPPS